MTSAAKAAEARDAVLRGAREIDMVINVGLLKAGEQAAVQADIRAVVAATVGAAADAIVKVIIETCYLTDDEKVAACRLAVAAGAHFVKTSTGFGTAGATAEDVKLMRATVGPTIGVKAAGGIRTSDAALAMIEAGASRLGASSGIKLLEGLSGGAL
jgi:deoxyribose-phosphate aldolase